jgi:hypothetical protein
MKPAILHARSFEPEPDDGATLDAPTITGGVGAGHAIALTVGIAA